jgi:5-methylcytosine-specific restriction endonuclease McrA
MARGKPIPPETKKAVADRSRGICEARLIKYGCRTYGVEHHHVKSRGRGGSNDPNNILLLCTPCHHAITVMRPGTAAFRTHSWQVEGSTEEQFDEQEGKD